MASRVIKLYTGAAFPLVGLGTLRCAVGEVGRAVECAIDSGYRHIDCAGGYNNEHEVGEALKRKLGSVCTREDLFVTSKLYHNKHKTEDVRPACEKTLEDLGLAYLDLYLIHSPMAIEFGTAESVAASGARFTFLDTPFTETWSAMEKLHGAGLVKHIGLANFNSQQIDEVMAMATVKPAVLQIESHPYLIQKQLIAHAAKHGMVTTAFSPLGSPTRPWAKPGEPVLLEDPKIKDIAAKYNKSPAQVLIRYQVERKVAVIPKSITTERIKANIDVFDFSLTPEDMEVLESFDCHFRTGDIREVVDGKEVSLFRNHPYYPFNIPY